MTQAMLLPGMRTIRKHTITRCVTCKRELPGTVTQDDKNQVFMERVCPDHGRQVFKIGVHPFYWHALGDTARDCCGTGCCSGDGKNVGTLGSNAFALPGTNVEKLSTCTALIDIVNSCNLPCPACYASSPIGVATNVDAIPFDDIVRRVQGVIDRKGKIEMIQLSGGEPTLHPEFFKVLTWALDNPGIDYVLVNTNGVRLATDERFVDEFRNAFRPKKMCLYLQYDGPQLEGQLELRGADLRKTRLKAIENAASFGLKLHLAMTVIPENQAFLWEALKYGTQFKNVLGISLQPMFRSGRSIGTSTDQPITASDIVIGLIDQSNGTLIDKDFTPLPCGDPNCQIVSGLARIGGELVPVVRHIDQGLIASFLKDKVNFNLDDLKECGCENQEVAEILKSQVLLPEHGFFIIIKPFMDAKTFDQHRIDRCCTHVIRPDGVLDSFCNYYGGFGDLPHSPVSKSKLRILNP